MANGLDIELILKTIPSDAGVYRYYDSNGEILYVGKAKNLKKRVSSYFKGSGHSPKTRVMVSKIASIQYVVVENEAEALLLENNLIKSLHPRYNILLKDDKTYPWICVKNEAFPRIFLTRRKLNDGSIYYGPYPDVGTARMVIDVIKDLFPIRTCKYTLNEKNIEEGRVRPCLEYHIKRCAAPCAMGISQSRYDHNIEMAHQILRGHFSSVLKEMKEDMMLCAEKLDFEQAHLLKEKIDRLSSYQSRFTVAGGKVRDADVFSIVSDSLSGYVNYMRVVQGSIIQSYTMEIKKCMDESDEELLMLAVVELRERFSSTSREVLLSIPLEIELGDGIKITVPQKGERHTLVELSERNARMARLERLNKERITDPEAHSSRLMQTMQEDLHLDRPPRHIECFDNSNIQGTNAVSSCVVFRDGRPSKKDYRHFIVRTVVGANDFATMAEVITHRYSRMINEGESLPDLIIVDGGKGQLSSAYEILCRLGIENKVKIIGIAKRLEELFYPDDPVPLYLDRRSVTLRVIQQLRDEAHRFGITHHRNRRSKAALTSELDDIKGIGEKTRESLLRVFSSVDAIREASREELSAVIGAARADIILNYYKKRTGFI